MAKEKYSVLVCHVLLSHSFHLQKTTSSASSEASEPCQSVSECNSPAAVSTHSHTYTHVLWPPGIFLMYAINTLTQTCLSIPQFGSCSSFGTFRSTLSYTGSVRPLSSILPGSPTFNRSPGSNTPAPTSKVPSWKVCFHLPLFLFCLAFIFYLPNCFFLVCIN